MNEIMNLKEVSIFLNLSISNVRKMTRSRKIPFLKISVNSYRESLYICTAGGMYSYAFCPWNCDLRNDIIESLLTEV